MKWVTAAGSLPVSATKADHLWQIKALGGYEVYANILQEVLEKLVETNVGIVNEEVHRGRGRGSTLITPPRAYKIKTFCVDTTWPHSEL